MPDTTKTQAGPYEQTVSVLLVDDDPANLLALEAILHDLPLQLVKAHSGHEALRRLLDEDYAAILLDVHMQGLDGFETAKLIRSQERSRHTPVIFLTADDVERPLIEQAYRMGAVDFLVKPLVPVILRAKVMGFVELFQKTDEVRRQAEQVRQLERRQLNDALHESEERFRASFDQAAVGLALVGLDRQTLWANPGLCAMLGYTAAELQQRTFADVTHAEDLDADLALYRRLLAGEIPSYRMEKRYLHKSGSVVWGDLTVSPVRDSDGKPKYVVAVVVDISERKRAEEALRDANRRKDQFLLMLAHELRNPLAPIQNALHVLRQSDEPEAMLLWSRDLLERQVKHLSRLVHDLLEIGRGIRGLIALQTERLDLARLVPTVAEDHRSLFEQAGLALEVVTPEVPVWLTGDPTRLKQVLDNLLQNSLKFTERSGWVWVRLEVRGSHAEVSVRDTGVGIAADLLPQVFEPFTQADQGLARRQGGLGVGLSLVRRLVQRHGGKVEAHSEGRGRGSTFTVRLPVEPEPAALSEMTASPKAPGKQLRILVVEDNKDAAHSLRIMLELYGHEVRVAYTGPEGVKAARQWCPDVVLCDIGLPGLDGYGVASALRRSSVTTKGRLIAVTGYGSDEDRHRSLEAGFHEHLTKPVDPDLLRSVLAQAASL
jgi:PAS domain S-box-containing protein